MEVDSEQEMDLTMEPVEEPIPVLSQPVNAEADEVEELPVSPPPTNQEETMEEPLPLPVLSPILPPAVRKSTRSTRLNNNKKSVGL